MKIPRRPPTARDLFLTVRGDRLVSILGLVNSPLVEGKYLHWEKLRYRTPPSDLSHDEWWLGLKSRRSGQSIPLVDKAGRPFSYHSAGPLQRRLHEIDLSCGGSLAVPEPVLNESTRNSYLVRSLIEEAFTSSQLEGAASTREIAKELVRKERLPRNPRERMILNNYRAMQQIIELKNEPLSRTLILDIHRVITEESLDDPLGAGRLRKDHERIVVGDASGEVFHEPPPAAELEGRLEAMCAFANATTDDSFVHPALRSMILHFWLAHDHPFIDGNGRTARALFYWSMLKHGYWLFEFVSISQTILKAPVQYGMAFLETETDENDLTYFLLYHADVVGRAVQELHDYINRRSDEFRTLEASLRGMATLNPRQKELIRHALRHPGQVYTVESHRVSHNVTRQTSSNDLQDLESKGLLERVKGARAHRFLASRDLEKRLKK